VHEKRWAMRGRWVSLGMISGDGEKTGAEQPVQSFVVVVIAHSPLTSLPLHIFFTHY